MKLYCMLPARSKDPESLQRLFRMTAIVSAVVILLFSGVSFYRVFSGFVIASAKDDSVQLCYLLFEQQKHLLIKNIPGQGARLAIDPDVMPRLDRNLRAYLQPFNIIKVKIYDDNGMILYSTDATNIGKIDKNNRHLMNSLAGNVDARLVKKEMIRDLADEPLLDVEVVETYVPVRDVAGKLLGSTEVYVDATKYRNMIWGGMAVLTTIQLLGLAVVFGLSYLLIRQGTIHLKQVQSNLEKLAITDVLTGIANRGHIMTRGEEEFSRALRNRQRDPLSSALSCIMLDIDHFKVVNDTWGHLAGDQVLREVAQRLRQCVRPYDIIGRYGGEEFVVLMPATACDQGLVVAERIRAGIDDKPICIGADEVRVSVSLGVSSIHENDLELDDLLKRADKGLYTAKDGGRNRVEWCPNLELQKLVSAEI